MSEAQYLLKMKDAQLFRCHYPYRGLVFDIMLFIIFRRSVPTDTLDLSVTINPVILREYFWI